MGATLHFIEPIDILFLRGNKLFGDPGSFGESQVPPWPSVAAGALRSALVVHRGYDPLRFARGGVDDPELGTPARPGLFTVTRFQIARRYADGTVEPLYRMPADVSITRSETRRGDEKGNLEIRRLGPHALPMGVQASAATALLAVLPESRRGKPYAGYWLSGGGWSAYLEGRRIDPEKHLIASEALWSLDSRIGVALDPDRRRAADGALFTSEGVVFLKRETSREAGTNDTRRGYDAGFLVEVSGATLPDTAMLRFGGDGRAATATRVEMCLPEVDYEEVAMAGRCRLILTAPGLFEGGWKPTGVTGSGSDLRFGLRGVRARLVCAAVPRAEVVSGFDVAEERPKAAQRAAPPGSVYWLDDLDATADALRKLAGCGLWSEPAENGVRRAEGFNRIAFGMY